MSQPVHPAPYVQIPLFATISGYSVKAIQQKIDTGIWIEGREYIKAPDGHRLISLKGYETWAKSSKS